MRFGRDMTGWLIYTPEGYALNRWFADRLLERAAAEGLALELKLLSESGSLPPCELPHFAVMRTIRPGLSAQLQARGVRCGVVWQNGEDFFWPDTIRVNLALPRARLEEALARLKNYVFV